MRVNTILFIGLVCLLSLAQIFALSSAAISTDSIQAYTKIVSDYSLSSDTLSNPKLTSNVISTKSSLKLKVSEQDKNLICSKVASQISTTKSSENLYYLSEIAVKLQCVISKVATETLSTALNSDIIAEAYRGTKSLFNLASLKNPSVSVSSYDVIDVLNMSVDLLLPDGTTRNGVANIASSILNSGYVYEILGLAYDEPTLQSSLANPTKIILAQIKGSSSKICNNVVLDDVDSYVTGITTLAKSLENQIDLDLSCFMSLVSEQQTSREFSSIASVLRTSNNLASNPIHTPFAVTVGKQVKDGVVSVAVTDVFGHDIKTGTFKTDVIHANKNVLVQNNKAKLSLPTGVQQLTVTVTVTKNNKENTLKSFSTNVNVFVPVAIKTTAVNFYTTDNRESAADATDKTTVKDGKTLTSPFILDLDAKNFFVSNVALSATPKNVATSLRLVNSKYPNEPVVLFYQSFTNNKSKLIATLTGQSLRDSFRGDGAYTAFVDVTGENVDGGVVSWKVGTFTVKNAGVYTPIDTSKLDPEIKHTFGAEQRTPFALLSIIFALITALPLVVVVYFITNKLNLKVKVDSFAGMGFIASLFGFLAFIIIYWLYLTIFQAIPILFIASLPLMFFAHRALSMSVQQRGLKLETTIVTTSKKTD